MKLEVKQFEGLKFVELQKVEGFLGKFKQENETMEFYPILFFAVYVDVKDQVLEFYPVFETDLSEGYLNGFTSSNYVGITKLEYLQ
jgi:hypothetical protein